MTRRTSFATTVPRRTLLARTGLAAAAVAGFAGCLGDADDGPAETMALAGAEPYRNPVDPTAVSWDDLGELSGELTIYSGRTPDQIDPVFEAIEDRYDDLDLRVDRDDNDTHVNQLLVEGDASPADLLYSQDPGALVELADNDIFQSLPGDILDAVPSSYRDPDGLWTGVSGRVRAIQYNRERWEGTAEDFPTDIMEFATDDRFRGIISTRPNSGTFRGFIQAMVQLEGEDETREWVRTMVEDQEIQLFSGGSDQAEAINRGGSDDPIVALGNSYYAARILNEDPDAPIDVTFTRNDAGCLFSVSGVGVLRTVDDPALVAEFVRHLLSAEGQQFMMDANGEYPVVEGVDYVGDLPDLDELDPPEFDLSSFDMDLQAARDLIQEEGMALG